MESRAVIAGRSRIDVHSRLKRLLRRLPGFASASVLLASIALSAAAYQIQYVGTLSGNLEVTPTNSPATGVVGVTFDLDLMTMRVQTTFSGLTSSTTAAHVHCCTTTPLFGAASVATQTPAFAGFPLGVTAGTYDHTFDMSLASSWNPSYVTANGGIAGAWSALLAGLASGRAYFNIHTVNFPAGEIRDFLATIPWDAFWRKSDGTNATWRFTGPAASQLTTAFPPGVETVWQPIGIGDVDGDGVPDVVWIETATGQVAIWLMLSPAAVSRVSFPLGVGAGTGWSLAAVADVNGDGRADLVWRNGITGQLLVWYMAGDGSIGDVHDYGAVPLSYELRGAGDVDGDGIADLVWFQPSDGQVAIWRMAVNGSFTPSFPAGVGPGSWRPYRIGDFDGDGSADIFWRNEATGATAAWYLVGGVFADADAFVGVPLTEWHIGSVGDLDRDGRADLIWHAPASGAVVRWLMRGRHFAPVAQTLPSVDGSWQIVP
jgi:CHRD domain-containing protein/VCBS repeat protein